MARLQVYSESLNPPLALNPLSDPFFFSHQAPVSQALPVQLAKPSQVHHQHATTATKNPLSYPSMYTSYSVPQPATFTQVPVSQVITAKLPDGLSSHWNREVTTYQDGHKMFPDFGHCEISQHGCSDCM